jgi:phosphoribosyl 1,2-cyclic phosphodiesterase
MGFASLIVQMKQLKRHKKLKIFCHNYLTETLKMFLDHSFVFPERSSFEIEYYDFEHGKEVLLSDDIKFTSKQNSHLDEYISYVKDTKTGLASSSFLLVLNERRIYYSGDVGSVEDLYLFQDQKPEIIITEATHIKWESLLNFIKENDPEKVYLTHFSDELEKELELKIGSLPKNLSEKIELTFDSLCLKL